MVLFYSSASIRIAFIKKSKQTENSQQTRTQTQTAKIRI